MRAIALIAAAFALAVLARTAWATLTPAQAAAGFKGSYNCEGRWATHDCRPTTHRITAMACQVSRAMRGYFDCEIKLVRRHASQKPLCGVIVIDTGFDVIENDHLIPCSTLNKPATTARV